MRSIDTQISSERVRLSRTHFDCHVGTPSARVSIAPRVAAVGTVCSGNGRPIHRGSTGSDEVRVSIYGGYVERAVKLFYRVKNDVPSTQPSN